MLIRGGRVVDPAQRIDANLDVRVHGDRIAELGEHLRPYPDEEIIEASGTCVAPGFIDMHVHLREPGNPEKETVASGTAAAAAGGFTAVGAMPNTQPPLDTPELVRTVLDSARDQPCRVYPIAAITQGRAGGSLLDYRALEQAGAAAFSDDGSTVMNARVLRDAAIAAQHVRGCFISHCEDEHLKAGTVMHEGDVSRRLGVRGSPALAEELIVARDLLVARASHKQWHIAHLSTAAALDLVSAAKRSGDSVTCEVTPHHLLLTDGAVERLGSGAKVNPPLRPLADVERLRTGVRDGSIDVFASDHAPHTAQEKRAGLDCGAVGFSGLEIAVGAYACAVPDLPLSRFVAMLSTNPARILNVAGGSLAPGSPGDITIFADRPWVVNPAEFISKGKSTPLAGMRFQRRAIATIVGGSVMMQNGKVKRTVHS